MVALQRGLSQSIPQGPVGIDWSHPLADGMTSCALVRGRTTFWDHARGLLVYNVSNNELNRAVMSATPIGPALTASVDVSYEPGWPVMDSNPIIPIAACSIMVVAWSRSAHAGDYLGKSPSADGDRAMFAATRFDFGPIANSPSYTAAPALLPAYMLATAGPAGNRVYRNGVLVGSAGTATSRTFAANEQPRIGNAFNYGTFNGFISTAYIWRRQLDPGEAAWIAAEPYAFLSQGVHRRIFLMGSGVTASPFRPQVLVIG